MEKYTATFAEEEIALTTTEAISLDIIDVQDGRFHILDKGKSYHAEVVDFDKASKQLTVIVNGNKYQLGLRDQYDQLVKDLGLGVVTDDKGGDILAPMPGLILDILVEVGQTVEKGTPLIILEAMKMENIIKADGAGEVKAIVATKGDAVEKKQLLIEMA